MLTHSDEPLTWEKSEKISGSDAADAVSKLKATEGRDLLIQGSSTLYPPLLSARLIDRLVLITFPVVLGKGKRIFDGSEAPSALKLNDQFVTKTGAIISSYEPVGDVPIGSFETKPPSEEELERRQKIEEGSW